MKQSPFSSSRQHHSTGQIPATYGYASGHGPDEDERLFDTTGDERVAERSTTRSPRYENDPPRENEHRIRPAQRDGEPRRSAADVWQMALAELAMTMPAPTYETWVRDTSVLAYEDGEFVVGVPHAYARDWLQNRLRPQIKRTLSRLLQRSVEVTFRVRPRPMAEPTHQEQPPLYRNTGDYSTGDIAGPEVDVSSETTTAAPAESPPQRARAEQGRAEPTSDFNAPTVSREEAGFDSGYSPPDSRSAPPRQARETHSAPRQWSDTGPDRQGGGRADNWSDNRSDNRSDNWADNWAGNVQGHGQEDMRGNLPENTRNRGDGASSGTYREDYGTGYNTARQAGPARPAHPPLRTAMRGIALNDHYTFGSFIVGNHNRLAHAAALSVSEQPGYRFNPLFIYGGVGLGKTHLLHAIGHQMLERGLRVLYCSSEQFTNELISAIRSQSTEEFRNKYRQVDLLLIDDIQFIGGKESTQEEFFHTFNHLHAGGRQVVISSDRPPKDIATLEARLRSRFEGGLQADISVPDLETRVAILQSKAQAMGAHVGQEVLMLVAERVESNIRELEGALNRLIVQSPLYQDSLNRQIAEEILNDLMPQRRPREAGSVIQLVAAHFNLTVEELLGRGRTKEVAFARQIAMYLLREENNLSLPGIGELLGGRDHSTVRYGVEKVIADMEIDDATRRHVVALREKVYAPPGTL